MKKFSECVGKMRVSMMTLAVVICCAMVASVFSSCSKNDDGNSSSGGGTKVAGARASVSFTQTEDMLKYCDVTVEYNDGTGVKTENVTKDSWSKTLDAKLPATISFKRTVTLKAGIDVASITSFKASTQYACGYCLLDATNMPMSTLSMAAYGGTKTMSGDQVTAYLEKGSMNKTVTYTFDANGKATEK